MRRPLRLFRLFPLVRLIRLCQAKRPMRPLAAFLLAALCLAALPCASAQAADVNPDGSIAPVKEPEAAAPGALEALKKAAAAQGDISPLTVKALQHDPKAMEAIGQGGGAPTRSTPSGGGSGKKSTKAMYGDIIIHK